MKLFVAKVVWYCDGEDGPQTDYLVVAGDDFTDALRELENYYGEDIPAFVMDFLVHLEVINPEHPFVRLPDEQTYEAIKERGEI